MKGVQSMKKIGFTLAEVIVTLAIVGVVTALVLPQFITGMHNQSNASKLSTVITDYENIFGMMLTKENKNNIFETEFGKAWTEGNQTNMKTAMAKYVKIARSSQDNNTKSLGYLSYLMNNLMPKAFAKPVSQGEQHAQSGSSQSQGCPEITTREQYENYCYSNRCPEHTPEDCFENCSIYKCGVYGLLFNTTCHYNDPNGCADKLETLCKCANKNETVSETNGPGCKAANTSSMNFNGNCGDPNTTVRPITAYCCTEQTTTCPADKPYPSDISFLGGNCTENTGGESTYCCQYEYPCAENETFEQSATNPGGCTETSIRSGKTKTWCCPPQMSCNSGETLIQDTPDEPWDGCRKVQSSTSSAYAWCCPPQKPSCSGEYPNLTPANGTMPSNCISAGTGTGGSSGKKGGWQGALEGLQKALGQNADGSKAYWCCKDEYKPCSDGGEYFETRPSTNEYECKSVSTGKGYCCEKKSGPDCTANPCACDPDSKQCCESKSNMHWDNQNQTCCDDKHYYGNPKTCHQCPVNKPNLGPDGKCCDNDHYYEGKCNKCLQGYSEVYGLCVKDPDPVDCDQDPNHKECCPDLWDGWNNQCCKDKEHYYGIVPTCHACLQGEHEYDGGCHKCKKEQYEYNDSCHNCPEGAHEVDKGWGKFECITCPDDTTWNGSECVSQGTEPTPTPETKPTPFRKITKQKANTDDIHFDYAETDSVTGANMLYSNIAEYEYTDAAGKKTQRKAATIYIDVNGKSGPNTFGMDVFAVVLDQDGHLYPYGSEKAGMILTGDASNNWKSETNRTFGCSKKGSYDGLGCTGRMQVENYQVKKGLFQTITN